MSRVGAFGAALLCAALSACAPDGGPTSSTPASALPDLPLPSSIASAEIQWPPANIRPEYAAFVGKWGGHWGYTLPSNLIVESVTSSGAARGVYLWGDGPNFRGGGSRFRARIENGTLSWGNATGGIGFEFRLAPDGTLVGERYNRGNQEGWVAMARMPPLPPDAAARAAASQHWLVGVWKGTIAGYAPPEGPQRVFTVDAVAPDGTAVAGWALESASNYQNTKATVRDDRVTVITSANSRVELRRDGDRLVGTFTLANGRTYNVVLTRSEQ